MNETEVAMELINIARILNFEDRKAGEKIDLKRKISNKVPFAGEVLEVEYGDDNLKVILTETKDGFQVTDYMNGGDMMRPITTYYYKKYDEAKRRFDKIVKEF
jgi:hypothetical protein